LPGDLPAAPSQQAIGLVGGDVAARDTILGLPAIGIEALLDFG
jgi:hypothetical protein